MHKRIWFTRSFLVFLAAIVGTSCLAASVTAPAGYSFVKTEADISEYRLDSNGLTVLLLPDHSAPAVSVMVTYRVGSRNESYGTTGATHLLEHLMFKGTQEHNKEAGTGFDQLLERTGAITNATTDLDRTNYFETVGSQDLELAIELEADRLRHLRLREDDRRPEMTVVRNEYERGENNPSEALEKEVWATAFLAHPYHHSTIGWRSDFEKVPIEKLRAFYDTFYWPNNATVSVIGDFEPAEVLALIKKKYGDFPKSPNPIPEVYTEEPPQTGPRRVVVKRPGELGVVMIAQKIPPGTNADYPALKVLGTILSDGRNSRLYQALTDKSLTTDVDAEPAFHRDPSLFIITAQLTPGTAHADVEQRLLAEIGKVKHDGVKPAEVAAAIAKLAAKTAYQRDGSLNMAFALNECIAVGDWPLYYRLDDAIRKVTAADVQRVAKKYFVENQRVTGWYIPENDQPNSPDAKSGDATTESKSETKSESSPKSSAPGAADSAKQSHAVILAAAPKTAETTPPPSSGAEIAPRIARTNTAAIDLLVCPTGVKDVVTISGAFPAFDASNPILGQLAAEMLERGTNKYTAEAIARQLDEVGAEIQFSYESGYLKFDAKCLKQDIARVTSLLADQLRNPSFPADEFEKLRKQELADAQHMREDTDAQACHRASPRHFFERPSRVSANTR